MDWVSLKKAAARSLEPSATNIGGILVLGAVCFVSAPIVGLLDTSLLRASLFPDAGRLVLVDAVDRQTGAKVPFSPDELERLQALEEVFSAVIPFAPAGTGQPDDRLSSGPVVWCFVGEGAFQAFGVGPLLGRTPGRGEGRDEDPTAVISYEFWSRHYDRDADVVGRYVAKGWTRYRIVGVMPRDFRFPADGADIWIPLAPATARASSASYLHVVSRVRPGLSTQEARSAVSATMSVGADGRKREFVIVRLDDAIRAPAWRALPILATATIALLMLASMVLTHFMIAEALDRHKEAAIRLSLGASRWAATSSFMVRSVILSTIGGATGIALAAGVMHPSARMALAGRFGAGASIDGRTVGILGLACAGVAAISALATLPLTRGSLIEPAGGSPGATPVGLARKARRLLLATTACCATFFLISAALSLESMLRLRRVAVGITGQQTLTVTVVAPLRLLNLGRNERYRLNEFFERLLDSVHRVPGVVAASAASGPPVESPRMSVAFRAQGGAGRCESVQLRIIAPDYLSILGIRIERGRAFARTESEPVALVNHTLEQQCWPGSSAEGQVGVLAGSRFRIVGVVADVRTLGRRVPVEPEVYLRMADAPFPTMCFVMRVAGGDPYKPAEAFRRIVRLQDAEAKVVTTASLEDLLSAREAPLRRSAILLSAVAAATLLVAVLGVYATCAADMRQKRRDLAIRLALGTEPVRLLLGQVTKSVTQVLLGGAVGCLFAYWSAVSLAPSLFEVGRVEPVAYAGCVTFLSLLSAVSAYSSASRVIRFDVWSTLRTG